jgi:hypothetical protein
MICAKGLAKGLCSALFVSHLYLLIHVLFSLCYTLFLLLSVCCPPHALCYSLYATSLSY